MQAVDERLRRLRGRARHRRRGRRGSRRRRGADHDALVLAHRARRSSISPPTRCSTRGGRRRAWGRSPRRFGYRPAPFAACIRRTRPAPAVPRPPRSSPATSARRRRSATARRSRGSASATRSSSSSAAGPARSRCTTRSSAFGCRRSRSTCSRTASSTPAASTATVSELTVRTLVHNPALHPGRIDSNPRFRGSTATRSSTRADVAVELGRGEILAIRLPVLFDVFERLVGEGITIYDRGVARRSRRRCRLRTEFVPDADRAGARARALRARPAALDAAGRRRLLLRGRAPGLEPRGRSLRYTLICLLGLQRAQRGGHRRPGRPRRAAAARRGRDRRARDHGGRPRPAALGGRPARRALARQGRVQPARRGSAPGFPDLEGLELSWIVIGRGRGRGATCCCDDALERQLARIDPASGLFRHRDAGRRARFPNFATQIYGVLALATAARHGRGEALDRGRAPRGRPAAASSSGPTAAGPGSSTRGAGRVVEPYEIYSVHQDAMAPMALLALSDGRPATSATRTRPCAASTGSSARTTSGRDDARPRRGDRLSLDPPPPRARSDAALCEHGRGAGGSSAVRGGPRPARAERHRPALPPGLGARGLVGTRAGGLQRTVTPLSQYAHGLEAPDIRRRRPDRGRRAGRRADDDQDRDRQPRGDDGADPQGRRRRRRPRPRRGAARRGRRGAEDDRQASRRSR